MQPGLYPDETQIHCWMVEGRYKPVKVTGSSTTGIATSMGCDPKTEDTITLLVDWENISNPKQRGTAVYTASYVSSIFTLSGFRVLTLSQMGSTAQGWCSLGAAIPLHGRQG